VYSSVVIEIGYSADELTIYVIKHRGSARKSASGRKTFKPSPREDPISLSLPPMSERQLGNLNTKSATTGFDTNKRLTYQRQTSSFWKV
jgi:hypothetical protein